MRKVVFSDNMNLQETFEVRKGHRCFDGTHSTIDNKMDRKCSVLYLYTLCLTRTQESRVSISLYEWAQTSMCRPCSPFVGSTTDLNEIPVDMGMEKSLLSGGVTCDILRCWNTRRTIRFWTICFTAYKSRQEITMSCPKGCMAYWGRYSLIFLRLYSANPHN